MNISDKVLLDLVVSIAGAESENLIIPDPLNPALVRAIAYLVEVGVLVVDEVDSFLYRVVG